MNPLAFLLVLLGSGLTGFSTSGSSGSASTSTSLGMTGSTPGTGSDDTDTDDTPQSASGATSSGSGTTTPTTPEPTLTVIGSTVDTNIPVAPTQSGTAGEQLAAKVDLPLSGRVDVMEGRVTTFELADDNIESVRILSDVPNGNITVNADNTLALVMTQSEFTGSQNFTYEVTHTNGSVSTHTGRLNVVEGEQANGWATGESHYMLATDANDKIVVEHGENHTKVYISESNTALSLQDIARAEGMNVSQITGDWLANSSYGQSESLALDTEAGMMLWNTVTPRDSQTSNWLMFERGYQYADPGRLLDRGTEGESELNPLYIGAWGTGDRPEIQSQFYQWQESSSNLVVQDIHFSGGVFVTGAENWIFDNVLMTEDQVSFQHSESITVRNSEFIDIKREASLDGGDWDNHSDRIQGFYMNYVDGVMLDGLFLDYNGWEEGYSVTGDASGGQPPSMWSHNIYFGANMEDITMVDTISMRSASYGAQIRSGGFFEDNVFIDNNAGFATVGGDYKGAGAVGNYSLISNNLVTSASYNEGLQIGAVSRGIWDEGAMTSLVGNIVAHLADPNSNEIEDKEVANHSVYSTKGAEFDDSIIYNWEGSSATTNATIINEQNTEGLDTNALDQTTIQNFTAQLLGKNTASIEDLANYLRSQADGALDNVVDADLILRFFQEGFGMDVDIRDQATTVRFEPDSLSDGVRWDNRMNWNTDDLPGLYGADDVNLAGNDVVFGTNAAIDELAFGANGSLNVYGGRLDVDGGFTGNDNGTLNIEGAGQVWADGSDAGGLEITVDGGRFANTGDFSGADMTVTGGEAILASDDGRYQVGASKTLAVFDSIAKVGFADDDGDMAILDFEEGATVAFKASDNDLGSIEEFASSTHDNADVQSGIDLGNATLSIDLAGLSASNGTAFTLMDADEIVGIFDDAAIGGLGSRNAKIIVNYETDSVTLELTAGNGQVSVETVGQEDDVESAEQALWNALTADQGTFSDEAQTNSDDEDILDAA